MKEKLLEELDKIENHIFMLDMIDHWEESTSKKWDELQKKKKEIENKLEKIENE